MSKILNIDEMLIAVSRSGMPGGARLLERAQQLAQQIANELAEHLGVEGPREVDFMDHDLSGGVLAGFAPRHEGDPIPPVLEPFDTTGDWEPRPAARAPAPRPG